jgi:hypothetical protein
MITTPKVIEAIIQSLPNKSELDIYALNIPNMRPRKLVSQKTNESFTPDMVIKSKDLTHVFSIEIEKSKNLNDSFLQKARLFSLYAQEHNGKLYIVGSSRFISLVKPELRFKYDNVDFLTIQ